MLCSSRCAVRACRGENLGEAASAPALGAAERGAAEPTSLLLASAIADTTSSTKRVRSPPADEDDGGDEESPGPGSGRAAAIAAIAEASDGGSAPGCAAGDIKEVGKGKLVEAVAPLRLFCACLLTCGTANGGGA